MTKNPTTHYYGVMPLAGLAVYAAVRLRGRARTQAAIAFGAAAVVFLVLWAPAMYQQRHSALAYTLWLEDSKPGHFARPGFCILQKGKLSADRRCQRRGR